MITGIEVRDFRGIGAGTLDGLASLTVLTGKNGCGKSAVLDALLLGASPDVLPALHRAVDRHPVILQGVTWLVRRGAEVAQVRLVFDGTPRSVTRFRVFRAQEDVWRVTAFRGPSWDTQGDVVAYADFDSGDRSTRSKSQRGEADPKQSIRTILIDPGVAAPLQDAYAEAVRAGRKGDVLRVLQDLLGPAAELEILTDDGKPSLYLHTGAAVVPVALAGDGLQSLVQTVVSLAACGDGLALLEEPEAFQHPSALQATAAGIVASVKRGLQVVLTTHSQELIDRLLDESRAQGLGLERVSVATLELDGGKLLSTVRSGEEIIAARGLGEDLR